MSTRQTIPNSPNEVHEPESKAVPEHSQGEVFSYGHALLIGVGADLPVTVKDATALRDMLIDPKRAAYPSAQVELLTETTATRQGILAAFGRLTERANVSTNATVFIYFSGHGGRIEQPGKSDEYFLVPYLYDPSRRADTGISGLEFTDKVEAIRARKLIVLLDCCHAAGVPSLKDAGETFVKSPVPPELLDTLETGSGRIVVASSNEDEFSYTGTSHSIFTACLLEALSGRAAVNKDGFARILDVLIYLFQQVPLRAPGHQHPLVKQILDLGGNFPLCFYAGGDKHIPGEAPAPEPASGLAQLTTLGLFIRNQDLSIGCFMQVAPEITGWQLLAQIRSELELTDSVSGLGGLVGLRFKYELLFDALPLPDQSSVTQIGVVNGSILDLYITVEQFTPTETSKWVDFRAGEDSDALSPQMKRQLLIQAFGHLLPQRKKSFNEA